MMCGTEEDHYYLAVVVDNIDHNMLTTLHGAKHG